MRLAAAVAVSPWQWTLKQITHVQLPLRSIISSVLKQLGAASCNFPTNFWHQN